MYEAMWFGFGGLTVLAFGLGWARHVLEDANARMDRANEVLAQANALLADDDTAGGDMSIFGNASMTEEFVTSAGRLKIEWPSAAPKETRAEIYREMADWITAPTVQMTPHSNDAAFKGA